MMKKPVISGLGLVVFGLTLVACQPAPKDTAQQQAPAMSPEPSPTLGALSFSDYAVRAALGNVPNTAAYVTITNTGKEEDRLISASCDCALEAQTHTMKMQGDQMQMAESKDGFVIKPGESLVLKPGSDHIMLMGLKTRPEDGQTQNLTLTFEKAGSITLAMPVSLSPLSDRSPQ